VENVKIYEYSRLNAKQIFYEDVRKMEVTSARTNISDIRIE
jgi:hypothetical protein